VIGYSQQKQFPFITICDFEELMTWMTFVVACINCRWEVPLPHALRAVYTQKEGTDPRFIKLEPVFKCSMLKRGSLQR
jgi:hypothetical protein